MMDPRRQRNDKTTLIRPRPTRLSGIALIVSGAVFLLFSIVPFGAAEGEAKPFIIIFGIIWVLACLSFIAYGIYILMSKRPSSGIVFDIESNASDDDQSPGGDFETRIRKLEKLKEDQLITEKEYKCKREEIMKERW